MKIYLVGGAVRNSILNLPITDKDWVVVGGYPDFFLKNNFKQVGKSFPVFLHPKTNEEYALARKEKKIGVGYTGFKIEYNSNITLKEDLSRRDLTINAIAQDKKGNYIDPFNGIKDLKNGFIRHISHSFQEDPLRILRVARFSAEFSHIGFTVAPDTMRLMINMVKKKEILYLEPFRIWKEIEKAMKTKHPHVFFHTLESCSALPYLFPELNQLWKLSVSNLILLNRFSLNKILLFGLSKISQKTKRIDLRIAYLFLVSNISQDNFVTIINKLKNKKFEFILIKNFLNRIKTPLYIKNLVLHIVRYKYFLINIKFQSSQSIINMFYSIDAWRKPKIISLLSILINYYYKNIFCHYEKNKLYYPGNFLKNSFDIAKSIPIHPILNKNFKGIEIRKELNRQRIKKIEQWRNL
ncbi:tRNA CCA-pyrophosphorylase [Buchnera aphidicola (Kurisakia onigurumii)]|uniref:tRNA CCA-pyrophosphorylase n=1 Tax=Buchnera aphidicola TaxID=9 RepID=UPI0031B6F03E